MTLAELQASIREAEAALAVAAPEMRDLLARQIATLRSLEPQLRAMEEAGLRAPKLPLAKEMVALFTPRPPAQVPTWIPDDLVRSQVTAAILRCPPGATVYEEEDSVSCALAPAQRGGVPPRQGITLDFYRSTGRLSSQTYFEGGCRRWGIDYHASGGRSMVAFYASPEPRTIVEHGLVTRVGSAGHVESQGDYDHGVRVGWHVLWDGDDGGAIMATRYERGVAVETRMPDGTRGPGAG
ncbi:MAG: hypothetical protein JNL38_13540 [Myxococcales bacterium]|nr:hypothetical protein [Myxococcales bacterium]